MCWRYICSSWAPPISTFQQTPIIAYIDCLKMTILGASFIGDCYAGLLDHAFGRIGMTSCSRARSLIFIGAEVFLRGRWPCFCTRQQGNLIPDEVLGAKFS
jgi:hypothetical protein